MCAQRRLKSACTPSLSDQCLRCHMKKLRILEYPIIKTSLFKYVEISPPKTENFQIKNSDIFHISAQNIGCGYSLESHRQSGSNDNPQSMFWSKNKKNNAYPCKPQFLLYKSELLGGSKLYRHVFVIKILNVQAILNLGLVHMPKGTFSDVATFMF